MMIVNSTCQKLFSNILTILLQLLFMVIIFKETECWRLHVLLCPTEAEPQNRWAVINLCHILRKHSSWNQSITQFPKQPMQSTLRAHVVTLKCPPRAQQYIQGFLDQLAHIQEAQLKGDKFQAVTLVEFTSHITITYASLVWEWASSPGQWN